MKTKVVCYSCNEPIDRSDRCPLCGTVGDIGFEETREWHWLCRMWAGGKGYWADREITSLLMWFEKNPEQLTEWKAFKARLLHVETIPLPTHLKNNFGGTFEHWINNSGLLPLTIGTMGDLLAQQPIGPLVHRLASNFANYHKGQWEQEDKARAEEEKLKAQKETPLLKRIKEGRRRRNHERV